MTSDEAFVMQSELSRHFSLSYWFGTSCVKCCGVFPRFMISDDNRGLCWYQCDVCGTRTFGYSMPWLAADAWNSGLFIDSQLTLF